MNPHYTYLLLDIAVIFFPLILSFDKKVAFYKRSEKALKGILFTGVFFVLWDIYFTKWSIWAFNDAYTMGIKILGLPVEELLFFVTVPYACSFIYECVIAYIPFKRKDIGVNLLFVLGIALVDAGIYFRQHAYTYATFMFCGAFCFMIYGLRNNRHFGFRGDAFLVMYLISIIPFLVVNGILTALPVVVYNSKQIVGMHIRTIPVEDTIYGMLLMLGNVFVMTWGNENVSSKPTA